MLFYVIVFFKVFYTSNPEKCFLTESLLSSIHFQVILKQMYSEH